LSGYLADTSVFVASEQQWSLGTPPAGDARISVATLTELALGVHRAGDPGTRQLRETTLARAKRFIALPYDESVATELAALVAAARAAGRRAAVMDAIIAATALVHDLTVWTQDDDFGVLAELAPRLKISGGQVSP
jgi:predicted nucleic acid-binding protein